MTKKNAGTAVISSTAAQKTFLEYASSMEYDRYQMEEMKRSLDQIEYNSRLTGYYAEVTARSAKYLAWKQGYEYHRYIV